MSITNGSEVAEENAENAARAARNVLAECVNALAKKVGLPIGKRLSEHAAVKSHEDVPSDAVESREQGTTPLCSLFFQPRLILLRQWLRIQPPQRVH